jgi:FtsZ-binding cell division protein ZapB
VTEKIIQELLDVTTPGCECDGCKQAREAASLIGWLKYEYDRLKGENKTFQDEVHRLEATNAALEAERDYWQVISSRD